MLESPDKRKAERVEDAMVLALKLDEGTMIQGTAGNFQKLEKERFSLRVFRRNEPYWNLYLTPGKPILDLGFPEL